MHELHTSSQLQQPVRRNQSLFQHFRLLAGKLRRCTVVFPSTRAGWCAPSLTNFAVLPRCQRHRKSISACVGSRNGNVAPVSEPVVFEDPNDQPLGSDGLPHRGPPHKHHWWDDEDDPKVVKRPPVQKAQSVYDSSLNLTLVSDGTSISQLFDQDAWERHRSIRRYFTNVLTMGKSTVFRRIQKPCFVLTALASALCLWNGFAPQHLPRLALAPTAHNLLGAAISLLLVFRTNASYARFQEARKQWGQIVKRCRDALRLAACYAPADHLSRWAAYVQAFPWVLKAQLRGGRTRDDPNDPTIYKDDPRPALAKLLSKEEAASLVASSNMPFATALRLTRMLSEMPNLPDVMRLQMDTCIGELVQAAGGCERLLGTPVPLSYTRHTSRCMMLWLLTLPAALWPSMGLATVPAAAVVTFVLIGIDELGVQIEESFSFLPLAALCKTIERDAAAALELREKYGDPDVNNWATPTPVV